MLEKLTAFYRVFTAGQMVANPVAWKHGQITGGLVAGFLGACIATAKVLGYEIPLSDDQLLQIGGAVVALFGLFNAGATVASTDKLGLSPRPEPVGPVDSPLSVSVPAIPAADPAALQPVRHAANGDVLDGLDTTFAR